MTLLAAPEARAERAVRRGPVVLAWLLLATAVAVVAVALGGGAPQPVAPGLPDPGAVPGWSLPLLRLAGHVAALVAAATALAALLGTAPLRRGLAAGAGLAWALSSLAALLLGLSEVVGQPVAQVLRADLLRFYALDVAQGRALLVTAGLALLLAPVAALVRGRAGAPALLVVALPALVPTLLAGHSADLSSHRTAQAAVVVHVLAAVLWVGGLAALALAAGPAARAAQRFSPLALACALALGLSGLVGAWLRLDGPADLLTTGYGLLLLAKTAALAALVAAGAAHRRRTLPLLHAGAHGAFRRLATAEVAVMAGAYGLAAALSRTPVG